MRILLAVFGVKITNNNNDQILSNFGGNIDFLKTFYDFANDILANVNHWDRKDAATLSLTCASGSLPQINITDREVFGFFDAGRNGDRFKVKDYDRNAEVADVQPNHSSTREAFYYLSIPPGSTKGRLVLQVPEGQGIKHLVEYCIRTYMVKQGLTQYRVQISNLINDKVFYRMMDAGLFKEMSLTKFGIPANIDELNNKSEKLPVMKGSMRVVYQATDLGKSWKDKAMSIFKSSREGKSKDGNQSVYVEILDTRDNFDEVSMKLEVNGKQKTFHVARGSRTLPDVDVTSHIGIKDSKFDINDFITQAKELIEDVSDKITENDLKN